jgi:hypothetical protein
MRNAKLLVIDSAFGNYKGFNTIRPGTQGLSTRLDNHITVK